MSKKYVLLLLSVLEVLMALAALLLASHTDLHPLSLAAFVLFLILLLARFGYSLQNNLERYPLLTALAGLLIGTGCLVRLWGFSAAGHVLWLMGAAFFFAEQILRLRHADQDAQTDTKESSSR